MKKIMYVILCFLFIRCYAPLKSYNYTFNESLALGTKGLVIEAADGSFKWEYGKQYGIPKEKNLFYTWYESGKGKVDRLRDNPGGTLRYSLTKNSSSSSLNLTTDYFERVNDSTAKKVLVYTPYKTEPMYGFLQLGHISKGCKDKSSSTRSYYIQVPESYVNAAQGGKTSVVYESYKCTPGYYETSSSNSLSKISYSSWVLWISDRPF